MTKKESDNINDDLPALMPVFEIESLIAEIENNSLLYEEKCFDKRVEAIDFIGFQIVDQIEVLLQKTNEPDKLTLLRYRAEKLKAQLEEIDINLFQQLRAAIRMEDGSTGQQFKNLIKEYVDLDLKGNEHQGEPGYDNLDILINGLFPFRFMPEQTKDLEPEMVFYQKTPARIVFELVEKARFKKDDVFFDLGSGLGQVAILVNLLAGVRTRGIEFEPAFCDYASGCAAELNLPDVAFINVDARQADYSAGTVFFMYTPFNGQILHDVLEILRKEALRRKIKIITYGPCIATVALQSWLHCAVAHGDDFYKPVFFTSL